MDPNNPVTPQAPQIVQPQPVPLPPAPVAPTTSVVTPKKKGGFLGKFIVFLLLILLVGGGSAGAYYYFNVLNRQSETADEETTPQATLEGEQAEEVSESLVAIPDTEIATAPETVNYTDDAYRFSIDYLSSWDFACENCGEFPEASASAWTVLTMKTFDYAVDPDDKIVRGSRLTIKASEGQIASGTDYVNSTYNGIEGKLNLNPSTPTQGFIYEDTDTGLFMQLEWKSTTAKDRSDQELQEILKSFKKI